MLNEPLTHEYLLHGQEVIRILYLRSSTIGLLHTKFHKVLIQDGCVATGYMEAFVCELGTIFVFMTTYYF